MSSPTTTPIPIPLKPVIVEKTALLQVFKNAMLAILSAEKEQKIRVFFSIFFF